MLNEDVSSSSSHRTPDLMDNDPLLQNLKALHEETRSDNDDDEPSTSAPKRCSPSDGIVVHQKKNSDPGRFMWIWLMGIRVPSLVIDGEPHTPIEIFDEVLARQNVDDAAFFRALLRNKNVFVKMGTQAQFNAVNAKSDVCRQLKMTTMSLMSRSDIERIMGELRRESRTTKVEHDEWKAEDRVHVVHVNFIDYCEDWLESDNLDEDALECGTHGFWYKSRQNMRCIECRECGQKFTPPDFVMHHHYPIKNHGMVHHGCNSALWHKLIEVHSDAQTEENAAAWRKFVMNSHRIGKRAYDEAEPQERRMPDPIVEEEEGEPIEIDRNADIDKCKEKRKLHIADYLGPSGSKGIKPRNKLEELILDSLNHLDDKTKEMLFIRPPEELFHWMKEMDFAQKVIQQQEQWKAKLKDPNYKPTGSANFDVKKQEFENMFQYESAPRHTKQEIQQLTANFAKSSKAASADPWEAIRNEQALLKNISEDAMRVLNNQPLPPKVLQPIPISLANINLSQLMPSLHMPLPQLPIGTNAEFLKTQISVALSNPALIPMLYPKLPFYEQLSQFLKASTVQN